jgi:hypothetical protein
MYVRILFCVGNICAEVDGLHAVVCCFSTVSRKFSLLSRNAGEGGGASENSYFFFVGFGGHQGRPEKNFLFWEKYASEP